MIEHTAHIEAHDAVTYFTVNTGCRVTNRPACSNRIVVTGITALADNVRSGMVWIGRQEAGCGMAVTTFATGHKMTIGLAPGNGTIMATGAHPGNTGMIKAAIRVQLEEGRGIVAVITFGSSR